jgi:hypothetical protein
LWVEKGERVKREGGERGRESEGVRVKVKRVRVEREGEARGLTVRVETVRMKIGWSEIKGGEREGMK